MGMPLHESFISVIELFTKKSNVAASRQNLSLFSYKNQHNKKMWRCQIYIQLLISPHAFKFYCNENIKKKNLRKLKVISVPLESTNFIAKIVMFSKQTNSHH